MANKPLAGNSADPKQQLEKLEVVPFFKAILTGTKPKSRGLPTIQLTIVASSVLTAGLVITYFIVEWIIMSTSIVSTYILPIFLWWARAAVHLSAAVIERRKELKVEHNNIDTIDARTLILTMSVLHYVSIYLISSVMSVTAQFATSPWPYNNGEPRIHKRTVLSGLPHRMTATHDGLYESFPTYVLAAGLTLYCLPASAPLSSTTSPAISIAVPSLVLYVFSKLIVWPCAYLTGMHILRSTAHMFAIIALILVILGLVQEVRLGA